jgi:hypothetical protein
MVMMAVSYCSIGDISPISRILYPLGAGPTVQPVPKYYEPQTFQIPLGKDIVAAAHLSEIPFFWEVARYQRYQFQPDTGMPHHFCI